MPEAVDPVVTSVVLIVVSCEAPDVVSDITVVFSGTVLFVFIFVVSVDTAVFSGTVVFVVVFVTLVVTIVSSAVVGLTVVSSVAAMEVSVFISRAGEDASLSSAPSNYYPVRKCRMNPWSAQ